MLHLRKGDRVVLTRAGERLHFWGRDQPHTGTVTSNPQIPRYVNVRRDGLKTSTRWWHGFWKLAARRG